MTNFRCMMCNNLQSSSIDKIEFINFEKSIIVNDKELAKKLQFSGTKDVLIKSGYHPQKLQMYEKLNEFLVKGFQDKFICHQLLSTTNDFINNKLCDLIDECISIVDYIKNPPNTIYISSSNINIEESHNDNELIKLLTINCDLRHKLHNADINYIKQCDIINNTLHNISIYNQYVTMNDWHDYHHNYQISLFKEIKIKNIFYNINIHTCTNKCQYECAEPLIILGDICIMGDVINWEDINCILGEVAIYLNNKNIIALGNRSCIIDNSISYPLYREQVMLFWSNNFDIAMNKLLAFVVNKQQNWYTLDGSYVYSMQMRMNKKYKMKYSLEYNKCENDREWLYAFRILLLNIINNIKY